jgi:hypothetical protein
LTKYPDSSDLNRLFKKQGIFKYLIRYNFSISLHPAEQNAPQQKHNDGK